MNIVNYTPFPALALEGLDQHGHAYHVLVLRQTISLADGVASYAPIQTPLCETDVYFGPPNASSVKQESDLCSFKPKCDVIVNASAYAPSGIPCTGVEARLVMQRPAMPAPLPRRPQGMNQFVEADSDQLQKWARAVEHATRAPVPGQILIDKTLSVSGERQFKKKRWLVRVAQWMIQCATLGLIRPAPWKLTQATAFTVLPLRYEFAYGGQCRVNSGAAAAKRIDPRQRLTAAQLDASPDHAVAPADQPVAHTSFEPNPVGMGFAQGWFVKANALQSVEAPRIAQQKGIVTARQFSRWLASSDAVAQAGEDRPQLRDAAGFGIRVKTAPARLNLLGTADASFAQSDAPLPADFDSAYWNAAPPDQQVDYPRGDETFTLVNMCAPNTPGIAADTDGGATFSFTLLRHECYARVYAESGAAINCAMNLDTIIVDADARQASLVWRLTLKKVESVPLGACELRMWSHDERKQHDIGEAAIGEEANAAAHVESA